jgi:hypothetical protein
MINAVVIMMSNDNEFLGLELRVIIKTNKNFLIYLIGAIANLKCALVKYLN